MLVIRLLRIGKKNQPSFKIVVTEKKSSPTKGTFVEEVGFWNPLTKERNIKKDRVEYWISVGAKPSDTVYNMLLDEGLVKGEKKDKHSKPKKKEGEEEGGEEKKEEKKSKPEEKEEVKEEPKKEEKKEEASSKEEKEEKKEQAEPKESEKKEEKEEEK